MSTPRRPVPPGSKFASIRTFRSLPLRLLAVATLVVTHACGDDVVSPSPSTARAVRGDYYLEPDTSGGGGGGGGSGGDTTGTGADPIIYDESTPASTYGTVTENCTKQPDDNFSEIAGAAHCVEV